jgi:hypothetical protein
VGEFAETDVLFQFEPASERWIGCAELGRAGSILVGECAETDVLL